MNSTVPVFILGSGRSGTLQMVKLLENIEGIQAHHEYLFEKILKSAVLYRMGVVGDEEIKKLLMETYVPAVYYANTPIWLDSSNALPWIVKPLHELFPNARFIHLLRDGRKVVSSFYHKFTEVVYDDQCVNIVKNWLDNPDVVLPPPPEKKYWRPFPVRGEKYFEEFAHYSRFQRLCYYWQDCNMRIRDSLAIVPDAQKLSIHLEDLVSNSASLARFLEMFGVAYDDKYMQVLKRPVNVAVAQNFLMTEQERLEFEKIAGEAMKVFGYDALIKEYQVAY
ncbi:sulfotransferase [Thiobacillus sp.]